MEVAKAAAAAVAAARSATPPQSVPVPGAAAVANSSSTPPASLDYTPRSSPPSSLNNMPGSGPVGGLSPRASPPTLVPSAMSMVSMASMLGHPPPFGLPLYGSSPMGPGGAPDFASSMHKFMDRKVMLRIRLPSFAFDLVGRSRSIWKSHNAISPLHHRSFGGGDSPPPSGGTPAPTNDPSVNECKIVEYRGEKVAAFMINGKTMLCLPQAFELFLKVRLDA